MYKKIAQYKDEKNFGNQIAIFKSIHNYFIIMYDRGNITYSLLDCGLQHLYPIDSYIEDLGYEYSFEENMDEIETDFIIDPDNYGYSQCPEYIKKLIIENIAESIEKFYLSIDLTESEKKQIMQITDLEREKNTNDYIYKKTIYINNLDNKDVHFIHLNICYCNLFDNCDRLYELCNMINDIKPKFVFTVLDQQETIFDFAFMDFLQYIYNVIKPFKCYYDDMFGKLSVAPGKSLYKFYRKNKDWFCK